MKTYKAVNVSNFCMGSSITDIYSMFDTSIVSDALDQHNIEGVITGISPTRPEHKTVGRAHPMRFELLEEPEETTNFPYAMLNELVEDRVLAIDGVGPDISCWGGNASRLAENAGVNGLVIHGGFRDIREIREGSFPVFARQPTPKSGQGRIHIESIGDPIDIDGVAISSDDIIVADSTGVVVVPEEKAVDVAQTAEATLQEELLVEHKIERGATVEDLQSEDHEF